MRQARTSFANAERAEADRRALKEIESWMGTPHVHQARGPKGPHGGVDCVGLLVAGARAALGVDVLDYKAYSRVPRPDTLLTYLSASCDRVSRPGDPLAHTADHDAFGHIQPHRIAVFSFSAPHLPQHAGYLVEGGFVHTHAGLTCNRVMFKGWSTAWKRRLHSVWELRWPA